VVVAKRPLDLRRLDHENTFFVLELPEGIRTAFGSRGGHGDRRLVRVYQFACGGGSCRTVKVVEEEAALDRLELPYHAAAMAFTLPDGTEKLVAGVVDEELAAAYEAALQ